MPQSDLGPLMQSAKALQIKGLSGGNSEEKISEFASYLAQQQQQQQQQLHQYQPQPQQQQPLPLPLIQTPMMPTASQPQQQQQMATPFGPPVPIRAKRNSVDEVSVSRMASAGGKKRRSKNPEEQTDLVFFWCSPFCQGAILVTF